MFLNFALETKIFLFRLIFLNPGWFIARLLLWLLFPLFKNKKIIRKLLIVKEEDISFAFFLKKKKEMMKKNEIFSWFFWIFWIFFYQKLNHKIKWITKSKEETKKRLIIIWKKNENSKWFKFKLFYFALHFSFFFWVHEKIPFFIFFPKAVFNHCFCNSFFFLPLFLLFLVDKPKFWDLFFFFLHFFFLCLLYY